MESDYTSAGITGGSTCPRIRGLPQRGEEHKKHKRLSAASPQPKLFGRDTPLLTEEGWLRHQEDVAKPPKRRRRRTESAQARAKRERDSAKHQAIGRSHPSSVRRGVSRPNNFGCGEAALSFLYNHPVTFCFFSKKFGRKRHNPLPTDRWVCCSGTTTVGGVLRPPRPVALLRRTHNSLAERIAERIA